MSDPNFLGVTPDGWLATSLGLLLGIPTLIWTIVAARGPQLRLEYRIWNFTRFINQPSTAFIDVRINGSQVRSAWQLRVRFANSGSRAISRDLWDQEMTLSFPEGTVILAASHSGMRPDNLRVKVELENNWRVVVMPVLINQGSVFEIQIVGSGKVALPEIRSHINGLPLIKNAITDFSFKVAKISGEKLSNVLFFIGFFGPFLLLEIFHSWTVVIIGAALFIALVVLYPLFRRSARKRREAWLVDASFDWS